MSGTIDTPGPIVSQGQVWTVGQWNAFFASLGQKVDTTNGDATNLTIHSGNVSAASVSPAGGGAPMSLAQLATNVAGKLDAANGTATGLAVVNNLSVSSGTFTLNGTTITGFGNAIGQALGPWVSSGGANLPMLSTSGRVILRKQNPAVADFADFQFDRTTAYTGGTLANLNRVLGVFTTIGPLDGAQNMNLFGSVTNGSTVGGVGTGIWGTAVRSPGSNGWIWAGLFDSADHTGLSTSAAGVPNHAGIEVDVEANAADDVANSASFGGTGVRKAVHIVGVRWNTADTTQTEISSALWFSTAASSTVGPQDADAHTNFQQVIGFGVNTQIRSALDTRGAITPAGSSNPVSAVTMTAGHVVDFNGGTTPAAAPRNYLAYDAATSKLKYYVGGVAMWSVDASGNMRCAGTVTGSVTP